MDADLILGIIGILTGSGIGVAGRVAYDRRRNGSAPVSKDEVRVMMQEHAARIGRMEQILTDHVKADAAAREYDEALRESLRAAIEGTNAAVAATNERLGDMHDILLALMPKAGP